MDLDKIIREHSGPPVNIEGIIRSLGIDLDKKATLDDEIAGQIEYLGGSKYKISANSKDHYYRQRFTLAHELGHFLYHSHLIGEGVDDDKAYRSVPDGRFYNQSIGSREETEANRFAASILMPREAVDLAWTELRDAEQMAKRFQVSKAAMQIRLEGLGLLPRNTA